MRILFNDAAAIVHRNPRVCAAIILGCIAFSLFAQTPGIVPLPPGLKQAKVRTVWDADPPEVKPAYFVYCPWPRPQCTNESLMGPTHWWYVSGDTNRIDIRYDCTNCGTVFFVRKATH